MVEVANYHKSERSRSDFNEESDKYHFNEDNELDFERLHMMRQ